MNRSTLVAIGLSAAAHVALLAGLATVVVKPAGHSIGVGSLLDMDSLTRNRPEEDRKREAARPATQEDIERLVEKAPQRAVPRPEPEEERVRLGVDDGKADTAAWLGFPNATEHHAQQSTVEQSALTTQAGKPGQSAAPERPELATEIRDLESNPRPQGAVDPQPDAREAVQGQGQGDRGSGADTKDQEAREAREFRERTVAAAGALRPIASMLDPFARAILFGHMGKEGGTSDKDRERQERIEAARKTESGTTAQQAVENVAAGERGSTKASQQPSVAPSSGGENGRPGINDESEAEATSLTAPVDVVVNGKVAAAKGLKIRTVAPEFATTTLLTARPRNPRVLITFSRGGRVTHAQFAPGMSTGVNDVDQPLLNAIYRWTAQGEPLTRLSAAGAKAELTITVNVLFP